MGTERPTRFVRKSGYLRVFISVLLSRIEPVCKGKPCVPVFLYYDTGVLI